VARMSPTARSIFAVIDGLLLFLALEGAFYAVAFLGLNLSFDTPTHTYLSANLVWALLSALAAGYTAARVAHRAAIQHGVALAVPFLALSLFNLNKGLGGRHTPFVVAFNTLVPLAFIWGAYLAGQRRLRSQRSAVRP
jgi:hypothetical protein